ncbi:hypothetical protein ACFX14_003351 [Malus domestica]|uniref:Uncharacterized protein n=1 Tax=Malus domestica TaxID=3750 RepID=A0A498IVX6_MALDO|nr:hypothetical protein DVH24_034296 [Malus domestica]
MFCCWLGTSNFRFYPFWPRVTHRLTLYFCSFSRSFFRLPLLSFLATRRSSSKVPWEFLPDFSFRFHFSLYGLLFSPLLICHSSSDSYPPLNRRRPKFTVGFTLYQDHPVLCINIWRRLCETIQKVMSVLFHFFISVVNLQKFAKKPKNRKDPYLKITFLSLSHHSVLILCKHQGQISLCDLCRDRDLSASIKSGIFTKTPHTGASFSSSCRFCPPKLLNKVPSCPDSTISGSSKSPEISLICISGSAFFSLQIFAELKNLTNLQPQDGCDGLDREEDEELER